MDKFYYSKRVKELDDENARLHRLLDDIRDIVGLFS